MHASDYVSGIIFGALVGVLGRLILPGRQSSGGFITVLIGIGAAVLGTFVARVFNVDDRAKGHVAGVRWSWWVLAIQVGLPVVAVALPQLVTRTPLAASDRPR